MKWRIYYADGSVYTSEECTPWDVPRTGVVAIAQEHDRAGWEIVDSSDQFYYEADRRGWYHCTGWTFYDHLIRAKHPLIIFGVMLSNAEFESRMAAIREDLPTPKTARLRGER